jgi:hypothetical protein
VEAGRARFFWTFDLTALAMSFLATPTKRTIVSDHRGHFLAFRDSVVPDMCIASQLARRYSVATH